MKISGKKLIGEGNWLSLVKLDYVDKDGINRSWESVERKKCSGAVLMIASLVPSGKLILIRQFRPPAGKYVLEFPAGLIDPGENPEETAIRELREETGYHGEVISISPPGYSSPGMTGETVHIARMTVNESEQGALQTDFDPGENIETILISPEDLPALIRQESSLGNGIDSKVAAYAAALI